VEPKKKISREQATKILNKFSWQILENKFKYYEGAKFKLKPIEDVEYDRLEDKYIKLAKMLNIEPTATNMVGFDYSRPSCRLVFEKLTKGK
jgi:hypothetical protein